MNLSDLTDQQLIELTRDWSDDKKIGICEDCGCEYEIPKNIRSRSRWCSNCSKKHSHDPSKARSYCGIKSGKLLMKKGFDIGN